MTPEERQMLSGLFDRIRGQANGPRDADAETFISDAVRQQPYAPYLLAQTVLVQEQGLSAANQRIQELEAQVRTGGVPGQKPSSGSFLGDLGRSIFGGGQQAQPQQRPPMQANYDQQRAYPPAQSGYQNQQQPGGPWGGGQPQMAPGGQMMAPQQRGGSSFLHGALGTAAGVAGGVLLADSMRNLFTSHSATAATMAGDVGGSAGAAGGGWGTDAAAAGGSSSDWGSAGTDTAGNTGSDWGSGGGSDTAGNSGSDWGSGTDTASNTGGSDWGGGGGDVAGGSDWGGGGGDSGGSFDV